MEDMFDNINLKSLERMYALIEEVMRENKVGKHSVYKFVPNPNMNDLTASVKDIKTWYKDAKIKDLEFEYLADSHLSIEERLNPKDKEFIKSLEVLDDFFITGDAELSEVEKVTDSIFERLNTDAAFCKSVSCQGFFGVSVSRRFKLILCEAYSSLNQVSAVYKVALEYMTISLFNFTNWLRANYLLIIGKILLRRYFVVLDQVKLFLSKANELHCFCSESEENFDLDVKQHLLINENEKANLNQFFAEIGESPYCKFVRNLFIILENSAEGD